MNRKKTRFSVFLEQLNVAPIDCYPVAIREVVAWLGHPARCKDDRPQRPAIRRWAVAWGPRETRSENRFPAWGLKKQCGFDFVATMPNFLIAPSEVYVNEGLKRSRAQYANQVQDPRYSSRPAGDQRSEKYALAISSFERTAPS